MTKELNLKGYLSQRDSVKGGFLTDIEITQVDDNGIHYFHYYKGFTTLKSAKKHYKQIIKNKDLIDFSTVYLIRKGDLRILDYFATSMTR